MATVAEIKHEWYAKRETFRIAVKAVKKAQHEFADVNGRLIDAMPNWPADDA